MAKKTWKPGDKVRLVGETDEWPVMVVKIHTPSQSDSFGNCFEHVFCEWRAKDGTFYEKAFAPEQLIEAV